MIDYVVIDSANNNNPMTTHSHSRQLVITHSAGFFSCATIALMDLVAYYNAVGRYPDVVDRRLQYTNFKHRPGDDAVRYYFDSRTPWLPPLTDKVPMPYDCMSIQFAPYRNLPFADWQPFIDNWFAPSDHVTDMKNILMHKYGIDHGNSCAVFYRGNDKAREMMIAPYEVFIDKCREVLNDSPDTVFVVLPDEVEFLSAMESAFPGRVVAFDETPGITRRDSAVFLELPVARRQEHGAWFFAATLVLSRCAHVITHSGNGGLWLYLYRGDAHNLHQWHNQSWI